VATHTELKGGPHVLDGQLSDLLESNLQAFLQWGLLGAGGFLTVRAPQSGVYGGDESRLRLASDPYYESGQVWEAFRKDWVWESGIPFPTQPVRPSGVWVGSAFHPASETGVYAHRYDYPNGRVVFDAPIPTASVVRTDYSYRLVQVSTADTEWWQQVQAGSMRADDPHFLQQGSGVWDALARSRVQLPAVIVDAVPNVRSRSGYEIGNQLQTVLQDVQLEVLAEDRFYLKWLHDVLCNQKGHRLIGFDKNRVLAADSFPLDPDGSPRPSGKMYPDLVRWLQEEGSILIFSNEIQRYWMKPNVQGSVPLSSLELRFEDTWLG